MTPLPLTSDAVPSVSSLDPLETSYNSPQQQADIPPPPDQVSVQHTGLNDQKWPQVFIHSGWADRRRKVWHAMLDTNQGQRRLAAFRRCGSEAYVMESEANPGTYRISGSRCKDRFCVPCANRRSRDIATNIIDTAGNQRLRFLTLTLKQRSEPLTKTIDRLNASFRKLRTTSLWKKHVKAGVAFIEVVWHPETATWNVHYHALITGTYIAHAPLSRTWQRITKDSMIVDIRLPKHRSGVASYVTKYACKPLNSSYANDHSALCEAIQALASRRLAVSFGGWGKVLRTPEPSDDAWSLVAPLTDLLQRAMEQDQEAMRILQALDWASTETFLSSNPPQPRPPPPDLQRHPMQQLEFHGMTQAPLTPFWNPKHH